MKKVVLLPIESFKRDALSRVYLANKLIKAGFEVFVGHPEVLLNTILPSIDQPIWLGRFISLTGDRPEDKRLLELLSKKKGEMYYLHDEGAFYADDNYHEALEMLHNPILMADDVVKKVCVWGDYQKNYLDKKIKKKVTVTGMYRFDLLKDSKYKVKNLKKKYGKGYTLINTRFPEVNLLDGEVGIFDKRTMSHYISSGISEEDGIYDMFKVWKSINESFTHFVYSVYKLVSENKESLFVIRPHPVESPEFYRAAFGYFGNVIIDNEENICDHILSADLVIHNECTTGVESVIANKPTINFVATEQKHIVGTSDSGILVKNYKELLKAFEGLKNKTLNNPVIQNQKYLANLEKNFLSNHKLVEIISNEISYSKLSKRNLYLFWNYSKLRTVIKFSLIMPILRVFKSNDKLLQYSSNELKTICNEQKYAGMNSIVVFSALHVKPNRVN